MQRIDAIYPVTYVEREIRFVSSQLWPSQGMALVSTRTRNLAWRRFEKVEAFQMQITFLYS